MANYFVINNKFKPYSFDELIKPYQIYGEAYKEQEAALTKLEEDAATLESALSKTNDPVAYATYTKYLNNVREAANNIATKGLNPATRKETNTLASNFRQQILPIQAAYNRRKELQDEQRKAYLANPTLYFQRNFNDTTSDVASLDKFVENPNYDYGQVFSGAMLEKQVADAAGILAKELTDYGKGKPLDKYTNTFLQQHGFTKDEVLEAIKNPNSPSASPVLRAIVDSVVSGSGVASWNDPEALQAAYSYARRGLIHAVGESKVSTYDNYGARLAAQKAATQTPPKTGGVPINPRNFSTKKEKDEYAKVIQDYSKYFTERPDGTIVLTDSGKAQINKYKAQQRYKERIEKDPNETYNSSGYSQGYDVGFIEFLNKNSENGDSPEKVWKNYLDKHNDSLYDAKKRTEYDYSYDETDQKALKNEIIENSNNRPLHVVEFNSDSNRWERTGETLSLEEFAKNYQVTSSRTSYGGTQVMASDGKNVLRLELPSGINYLAQNAALVEEQEIGNITAQIRELEDKGTYNGKAISEEERINRLTELYEDYNTTASRMYLYLSQIGLQNKTKPSEYSPYVY